MDNQIRRPGPESTLSDVREKLVEAAALTLAESGVHIGLGAIKLSEVIERAGVTRATAYRSLTDDGLSPQEFLRSEVMRRLLSRDTRMDSRALVDSVMAEVFKERSGALESDDINVRTDLLREVIRVGTTVSHFSLAKSKEGAILVSAYGAISSQDPSDRIWEVEELRRGEKRINSVFVGMSEELMHLFKARLRPGYNIEHFSAALTSVAEGLAMRSAVSDHVDELHLPTGPGASLQSWTLQGTVCVAMVRHFYEPVDPDNPFVDLNVL